MGRDGSSGNEVLSNGMWDGEALEDWDSMGNTITGVANHTGGSSIGVEGEDGLNGNIESSALEGLEHELGHLLSVGLWVLWGLGEEAFVLGWVDSELIGEAVLPDLLHILPGGNNTGFNWVGKVEDTSHLLGLISNVLVFGLNTDHSFSSWSSDDGWEFD